MSEGMGIVYSNVGITSASNTVSFNAHTTCLYLLNLDTNTNAEVRLNGGPHTVLVPHAGQHHAYVEIPGDYTKIQVLTANVSVAVYAVA
jgi:hypothetical protein